MTTTSVDNPMSPIERELLLEATGGEEPRLIVRSDTLVDVGLWWRRTPLWVCVTDTDVIVLAASRRRYIQKVAISVCRRSHYCHTTGELVIEAGDALRFDHLKTSPAEALEVLNLLRGDDRASSNIHSNPTENSRA